MDLGQAAEVVTAVVVSAFACARAVVAMVKFFIRRRS